MRKFVNIPPGSPCPFVHEEWNPTMDQMIQRAAHKLNFVSEEDAAASLVGEGCKPEQAFLAVKAAVILSEDRRKARA